MPEGDQSPYHHGRLRQTLLAAAESALRRRGADQLSLRELAREAGVSHAAPRRHFKDRQALLDALAVAGFERLERRLRSALSEAEDDLASRLKATVAAYIRFAIEDAALLELMFRRKHRDGVERMIEAAAGSLALLHQLIAQGQEAGELADGDPEHVGMLLFATMQGIATLVNGDIIEPELLDGLVDSAVDQFLRGAHPA
ncbi:TetR/AcrR family transcriptional regulator [Streptomyces lonarensis]|uniref:TetR/AcrR family transcriptional regulator n=1 Tax=Streptomyces lonarensis TaxID=700599 RepID=A0A7X6D0C3_9ACTN|nr:TetR/AcrR family transcriptional regulator [Streptomyces lonarensis]NJQ05749.1 TetR/AcrR family transcriptional regulator [Streptomyces lonarensis]